MVTSTGEKRRFIGLVLSGARSPHTAISAMDYFQGQGRLFLVETFAGFKGKKSVDLDTALCERLNILKKEGIQTEVITNAPLTLPPCLRCSVSKCPGKEECKVPETVYMMEVYKKLKSRKKNISRFMPYTQRFQEVWIRDVVADVMPPHEAMGSNLAHISSRIIYIQKMLPEVVFAESYPRASVARLMGSLALPERYVHSYRDIRDGKRIRRRFLNKLEDSGFIFIYDNDLDSIVNNANLFDAVILAAVGVLDLLGKTQKPDFASSPDSKRFLLPKEGIKL